MHTYQECQGCGQPLNIIVTSEYLCSACRKENAYEEKVRAFLEKYPMAEFGPGHIVLSDHNWDSIDWCLNQIREVREGVADYGDGITPEELDATETFLNNLKQFIG